MAVAEGRIHLTGLGLLAPHLTPENVEELLAAATHRRKSEIEALLAQRFPSADGPTTGPMIRPLSATQYRQLAPAQVGVGADSGNLLAPAQVDAAPERFLFQLMIGKSTRQKWQYVQALLSHAVSAGDGEQVLERALDALAGQLEKRKFGTTSTSRQRSGAGKRHVPAHVRHAVWKRDQGQCTFVGEAGHRCGATRFLQFDHIEPVARGGQATVEGMRLRCRAHNQYEAERMFGAGFMQEKRDAARRASEVRRAEAEARSRATAEARASADTPQAQDVLAALRELGYRAEQARRAVEFTEDLHDATLEQRVRAALTYLCPKATRRAAPPLDSSALQRGVDRSAQADAWAVAGPNR